MRPGHHRPLGTTTWMRFRWGAEREPRLGDIAMQTSCVDCTDQDDVRRAYRVIGLEEGRPGRWRLLMERVEYGTVPDPLDADAIWVFHSTPRGA